MCTVQLCVDRLREDQRQREQHLQKSYNICQHQLQPWCNVTLQELQEVRGHGVGWFERDVVEDVVEWW